MKKVFLMIAISVTIFSCKKDNETDYVKNDIIGTWELEQSICGYCTIPVNNYPPGNKQLIIFKSAGVFERKNQDTLQFNGNYTILKSKECNASGDIALTTNESTTPLFISLVGDKLQLFTPYCYADGTTNTYRRIN